MTQSTRPAAIADYAFIARLFPELAVPDPFPSEAAFATEVLPWAIVGLLDGTPTGYAFYRLYGETAHVVHLVVDRASRGRRLGEVLLAEVERRAKAAGCTRWYLNVKRENTAAIRLYTRRGFRKEATSWALRVPWPVADAVGPDERARTFVPTDADDAALQERFGMPPHRMAMLRARPGTSLLALEQDGAVVAFAAVDACYPGAYPFRATRGELAGPLLRALKPLADTAKHNFLYVTVEDDAAVAHALMEGGSEVLYEVERMAYDFSP